MTPFPYGLLKESRRTALTQFQIFPRFHLQDVDAAQHRNKPMDHQDFFLVGLGFNDLMYS